MADGDADRPDSSERSTSYFRHRSRRSFPRVTSGYPGPASPLAQALFPPVVTLGSTALFVSYAGLAPGEVGVYQINAQVPFHGIPTGMSVPLTITQGLQNTTVSVRVVNP